MTDGLNRATLLGNLGADPELRITPGGQAVCRIRLATGYSYLDKNNVRQETTEWHTLSIWGRRGEALAKLLKKGDRIYLEGRLRTAEYEKDGQKHWSTEVVVERAVLCGTKGGPSAHRSPPPADEAPAGFETGASRAGGEDDDIPF